MRKYRQAPLSLDQRIAAIEERLAKNERNPRAIATSVDSGSFTINGGQFAVNPDPATIAPGNVSEPTLLANGAVSGVGSPNQFSVARNTAGPFGSAVAIQMIDGGGAGLGSSTIAISDRQELPILSDASNNAAYGMNDPRYHVHFWDPNTATNFTSATFSTYRTGWWYMYHPHLRVTTWVRSDAGTTGEIALFDTDTGTQYALTSIAASANLYVDLILDRRGTPNGNSPNGNTATVNLQARRTGGTGNITLVFVEAVAIDLSFGW